MSNKDGYSLWTDSHRSRYFLIPDKQKSFVDGDFILYSLEGKKKIINSVVLASFEITESEAKDYFQSEVIQVLERTKSIFIHLAASSEKITKEYTENLTSLSNQSEIGQKFLSALQNITDEASKSNLEAGQTELFNFYTELKELLDEVPTPQSSQVEELGTYTSSLYGKLQKQGIDIDKEINSLPNKLGKILSSFEDKNCFQDMLVKLDKLLAAIRNPSRADGQEIDNILESLGNDFFADKTKLLEEERKQRCRQSAKDAIAASFRSLGLPSFSDGDLQINTNQQIDSSSDQAFSNET